MKTAYIIIFILSVLVLGAIGYSCSFLSSYGLVSWPTPVLVAFVITGGGLPTFAAVITTRLQYGNQGQATLFRQFNFKRVRWLWFVVSPAFPIAIALCVLGLWLALSNTYSVDTALLKQVLPLPVGNLVLNVWEEIARRDHGVFALQKRYSALVASLILSVVWTLWHWPLFFMKDTQPAVNHLNNYPLFVGTTVLLSIICTWLYYCSSESLLTVSLFRAVTNIVNLIVFTGSGIAHGASLLHFLVFAGLAGILIAVFKQHYLVRRKGTTA